MPLSNGDDDNNDNLGDHDDDDFDDNDDDDDDDDDCAEQWEPTSLQISFASRTGADNHYCTVADSSELLESCLQVFNPGRM